MTPKLVTRIASFSLVMLLASVGYCKTPKSSSTERTPQLSTDIKFDGLDANGRYQSPLGATAGISNDKTTLDLIDFRKSYQDRAEQALSGR